ncbi:hypothetical protein S7335_244 [Synechococcus sp. PCC 7335]|nr:hypothetical protein S7335_244 [Synechococcus sp. PCC 7335]
MDWLDLDGDGLEESYVQDIDTDGDGILDTTLVQSDMNGDGVLDDILSVNLIDTDGDGVVDTGIVATPFEIGSCDPNPIDGVFGTPDEDMENWHQQTRDDTCAIASQEFVLDEVLGRDVTEQELTEVATANGWYTPGGGTPLHATGNLLEAYGVPVTQEFGGSLQDIAEKLEQGQKVIVGVDADEIWTPGENALEDDVLGDYIAGYGHIPGQDANHAVQVIGIDATDPNNPMVILNDPGTADGQGFRVPAGEFENAWADSQKFMVSTTELTPDTTNQTELAGMSEVRFSALDRYGRPYWPSSGEYYVPSAYE